MPISLLDFFFLLLGNNHQKISSAVFPQLSSCFSDPCPRRHSFHSPPLPGFIPLGISSAANCSGHSFFASRWSWWFACSCFSSWCLLPFLFLYVCGIGAQGCLTNKTTGNAFLGSGLYGLKYGSVFYYYLLKSIHWVHCFFCCSSQFPQSSLL